MAEIEAIAARAWWSKIDGERIPPTREERIALDTLRLLEARGLIG